MRSAKVLYLDDDEYCDNGHVPSLTVEHAIAEAEIVFHRGAVIKNRCGPIGTIVPCAAVLKAA